MFEEKTFSHRLFQLYFNCLQCETIKQLSLKEQVVVENEKFPI
jgi:hypothetical protein